MLQVFSTRVLVNQLRQYYDAGPGVVQSQSGVGPAALYEDFLSGQSLDPRITFSRTSNATLTGSNGLIQYAPHNLMTYSEQFDNAVWTKSNVTVTANAVVAPDGTTTADKLVEDATTNLHRINSGGVVLNFSAGLVYAVTVYAQFAGRQYLNINANSACNARSTFDLVNGTVASTLSGTASITSVGGGWYRCVVVGTASTTGSNSFYYQLSNTSSSGDVSYAGDGVSGAYIWGAQLNVGSLQSYNPTTVKNLLGYTQEFDNAAWTKSNSFIQTNLLTYSQDFDNAAWTKTEVSVSANTVIAPDGTTTADKFIPSTNALSHYIQNTITSTTSQFTGSVYVKLDGSAVNKVTLYPGGAATFANFNMATSTVSWEANVVSASITDVGNGWYRLVATWAGSIAVDRLRIYASSGAVGAAPTAGDGTSGIYIWGAQLVQGATAGDYQTTYGTAKAVMYSAPDGSLSADKLVEDTATGIHFTIQSAVSLGNSQTYSFYAKAGERSKVGLYRSANSSGVGFDLAQGYIYNMRGASLPAGTTSFTDSTGTCQIQAIGSGWYRCSMTLSSSTIQTGAQYIAIDTGYQSSYTGDGTSGIYLWGAQLSDSASVDSYVYNPVAAPTAAAYYGPRFDYDPVTLAPKGLLIEEQRTNLLTYSEQFDNAVWGANNGTVTANTSVAPDGNSTADTWTRGANTAVESMLRVTTTQAVSTTYTLSVYAKAGTPNALLYLRNLAVDNTVPTGLVAFALDGTNTVIAGTTYTGKASISAVGNGWYRCSITGTTGATIANNNIDVGCTTTGYSVAGSAGAQVILWGAQLEAGAFATSYIPTVASQVTRAADTAIMQGANFSNWYNVSAGTAYAEFDYLAAPLGTGNKGVYAFYLNGSNYIVSYAANSSGSFTDVVFSGGVVQAGFTSAAVLAANTVYKDAQAYAQDNFARSLNGATVQTDSLGSVPTGLNVLRLGWDDTGSPTLNGHLRRFAYYNRRLANSELQGITS